MKSPSLQLYGLAIKALNVATAPEWMFTEGNITAQAADWLSPQQAYGLVGDVRRAINMRAQSLASMPFHFTALRGGEEISLDDKRIAGLGKVTDLLWRMDASLICWGAAYVARLDEVTGTARAFLPSTIQPFIDPKLGLQYFIRTGADGMRTNMTLEQMIYVWTPSPFVELGPGAGDLSAALSDATILHYIATSLASYFQRGMIAPQLIYQKQSGALAPMTLAPQQKDELRTYLQRVVSGVRRAFSLEVIDRELGKLDLSTSLKDALPKELNDEQRRKVATDLGIPYTMLYADAANYATAAQDKRNLYTQVVIPDGELIAEALNKQHLNAAGIEFRFTPEEMPEFQDDENERATSLGALVGAGTAPDLAMSILGYDLSPVEWARVRLGSLMALGAPYDAAREYILKRVDPKDVPEVTAILDVLKPAEPAAPQPPPPAELPPGDQPTEPDDDDETDVPPTAKALLQWQRKATKRVRAGKSAAVEFVSPHIGSALHGALTGALTEAKSTADVRRIFAQALAWRDYVAIPRAVKADDDRERGEEGGGEQVFASEAQRKWFFSVGPGAGAGSTVGSGAKEAVAKDKAKTAAKDKAKKEKMKEVDKKVDAIMQSAKEKGVTGLTKDKEKEAYDLANKIHAAEVDGDFIQAQALSDDMTKMPPEQQAVVSQVVAKLEAEQTKLDDSSADNPMGFEDTPSPGDAPASKLSAFQQDVLQTNITGLHEQYAQLPQEVQDKAVEIYKDVVEQNPSLLNHTIDEIIDLPKLAGEMADGSSPEAEAVTTTAQEGGEPITGPGSIQYDIDEEVNKFDKQYPDMDPGVKEKAIALYTDLVNKHPSWAGAEGVTDLVDVDKIAASLADPDVPYDDGTDMKPVDDDGNPIVSDEEVEAIVADSLADGGPKMDAPEPPAVTNVPPDPTETSPSAVTEHNMPAIHEPAKPDTASHQAQRDAAGIKTMDEWANVAGPNPHGSAGMVKDYIAKQISKDAGISYADASNITHNWAESSNNVSSLRTQEAAIRALDEGMELSDWQEKQIEDYGKDYKAPKDDWGNKQASDEAREAYAKAVYARTQEYFKERGIKEVEVYRGLGYHSAEQARQGGAKINSVIDYHGNALESWSLRPSTANNFGSNGITLHAVVPVERIFSIPVTGLGCLGETEVVIRNTDKVDRVQVTRLGSKSVKAADFLQKDGALVNKNMVLTPSAEDADWIKQTDPIATADDRSSGRRGRGAKRG